MTYGELQDTFKKRLNRRDITPSDVEGFLKASIQRTQRLLRTPGSEAATIYTVDENWAGLPIPGDFLKLVSITTDRGELTRVSLTEAIQAARSPGEPRAYARNRAVLVIGPKPEIGKVLTLVYHADFSSLTAPTDSNWLTEIASDIVINGALSAACKHFNDPRAQVFEDDYTTAITDLNLMAQDDELTNAAVQPVSSFDYGYEEGF